MRLNMKNILKYSVMMLLAVLAFTLGACTEEYEYTKVKANGEQVYFRNDISVASMAKDRDTVQVPVNRIQSKGELQVQLQVTQENNSKLSIPNTVTFADGETQTYLVISYDPATTDYGFSEDVTLAITDESLTTQYGNSSCSFKVEMSPWVSIGQGLYKDEAAAKMVFDMEPISSVDIQESVVTEGVYRVVMPYGPGTDFYNTLTEGYKLSWNNAENTSAIIDATDPEHVYLSQDFQMGFNVPFTSGETGIVHIFSYAQYYMEQGIPLAAIEAQFPEYFGTLEDGVITLPGRGLSMSTDETLTDKGYLAGNIQVALPGYQFVDYSSSFEYTGRFTDTDGNDYAQGEITLGRDVESAKYVVASEGDDVNAIIAAIEDGSLAGTPITESGAVSFTLTESGDYNMIIVTYGEDGKVHGSSVNPFTFTLSGDASAKPEWVAIATGTFTHNVQPDFILDPSDQTSYVGNPFIGVQGFTPTYQTVIYQDANNPSSYKVEPYIFQGNSLPFTMYSDGSISFSDVETGFTYGNYGNVLAGDYNLVSGQSAQYGYSSYYDAENNTYWFGTAFYILISGENAWLGGAYETFTVTSTTGVAPRKGMKANIKALLPKTAKAGTKHFKTFSGTKMQTAAVKGGLKRSVNK